MSQPLSTPARCYDDGIIGAEIGWYRLVKSADEIHPRMLFSFDRDALTGAVPDVSRTFVCIDHGLTYAIQAGYRGDVTQDLTAAIDRHQQRIARLVEAVILAKSQNDYLGDGVSYRLTEVDGRFLICRFLSDVPTGTGVVLGRALTRDAAELIVLRDFAKRQAAAILPALAERLAAARSAVAPQGGLAIGLLDGEGRAVALAAASGAAGNVLATTPGAALVTAAVKITQSGRMMLRAVADIVQGRDKATLAPLTAKEFAGWVPAGELRWRYNQTVLPAAAVPVHQTGGRMLGAAVDPARGLLLTAEGEARPLDKADPQAVAVLDLAWDRLANAAASAQDGPDPGGLSAPLAYG